MEFRRTLFDWEEKEANWLYDAFGKALVLREEYSDRLAWNAEISESFSITSLYNPYEINFE